MPHIIIRNINSSTVTADERPISFGAPSHIVGVKRYGLGGARRSAARNQVNQVKVVKNPHGP